MDFSQFYTELKTWQTAIGSLLGFLALLTGALVNYQLNRRRDRLVRDEEVASVAAALYGEILQQREEMARLARSVARRYIDHGTGRDRRDFDEHFVTGAKPLAPVLFPALAGKIGMLPPDITLPIVKFYSAVQQAAYWLPLLVRDPTRGFTYAPLYVITPAKQAVEDVEPTLRRLEMLLSIEVPADRPSLGDSDKVIDLHDSYE